MDTFSLRRLIPVAALVFLLSLGVVFPASAAATYATYAAALSACQAAAANGGYAAGLPAGSPTKCVDGTYQGYNSVDLWWCDPRGGNSGCTPNSVYNHYTYAGSPPPPPNPCTDANAGGGLGPGGFAGKVTAGMTWCKSGVPDPNNTGATVSCTARFTPSGPPTMNQWGSWHTPGTLSITGDTCDGSGGGGSNNWKTAGGQPATDPVPPSPATDPPKNPQPKACGGGSCYDPANDNFCAVSSSGQQFCLPGGTVRGSGGQSPGGCVSSGDSSLCAGSPSAPMPPANVIPDPPSAIKGNDTYTQADPTTGANQSITVTTYTNPGASPSTSGQQTGDSGPPASGGDPAPGSSTGGPSGSASGGGDCNSPPVCSGDAIQCAILRQSWSGRCEGKRAADALTGTGSAPSSGNHTVGEVDSGDIDLGDTSKLDMTGFGYGTACPFVPVEITIGEQVASIPMDKICDYGSWMRAFILLLAAMKCAEILGRK